MQLASGFMQLAAAGRRRNKVHFHCLFEGKMLIVHLNWDNHIQIFLWGGISSDIRSVITFYGSAYASS